MKAIIVPAIFILLCSVSQAAERLVEGNRTTENIPPISAQEIERAAQYNSIRRASVLSWHPSGDSLLISTRFAATAQLHLVSQPMGIRNQLTFYEETVSIASFSPTANRLVFERDTGGDEGQVLIFLSNLRTVPRARLSC